MEYKPVVIEVDSIISAGKTTFINEYLAPFLRERGLKVAIVDEPIDEWKKDIFPLYCENPQRWAYHFQTIAYLTRAMKINRAYELYGNKSDVIILDRGGLADEIFMGVQFEMGNVVRMEFDHYTLWRELWTKIVPISPNLYIYLNPPINEAMKRLRTRNRQGEEGITTQYQQLLKDKHDELFREGNPKLQGARVFEFDNETFDYTTLLNDVVKYINTLTKSF